MAAEGVGIVLVSLETVRSFVYVIKQAAEAVRQNECEEIARTVVTAYTILMHLCQTTSMAMHPAMGGALEDLTVSLERAFDLVIKCQQGGRIGSFFGARDMARELRRVQDDITRKLTMGSFAANVAQIDIALNNTQCAPAPPPPSPAGAAWWPNPAPSIPCVAPWSVPAWPVAPYAWSDPVPSLPPQPVPWPRPAWPSIGRFLPSKLLWLNRIFDLQLFLAIFPFCF